MAVHDSALTTLLPSTPYLLTYALPLLCLSVLLTFAGAFLTLDRTRYFPTERYGVLPGAFEHKKRRLRFPLEGGVGGLAIGYAFGVHLSTFLALLVPAISSSSPLNSKSFVPVWLLSCLITTFLSGRWRYCALGFVGITGGALFGLAVSVIIHPSLLARIIITVIFSATLGLFVLLPIPRVQHSAARFACSATGAFGLVISIALLAHIPAWANVWERLWLPADIAWGTTKEKGLSGGFCLLLAAGIASDWLLKRQFGECPDEKWDTYLANYVSNLPNASDRAGTFTPFTSAWDRFFGGGGGGHKPRDIVFPDDDGDADDVKLKHRESFEFQQAPAFLKKGRSVGPARFQARMGGGGRRQRDAVKFRPVGEGGLSSDEEDGDPLDSAPMSPKLPRPWLRQKTSMASTTPTLVDDAASSGKGNNKKDKDLDFDKEMERVKKKKRGVVDREPPDYSDFEEEDVTNAVGKDKDGKEWSPGFMQRHGRRSGVTAASSSAGSKTVSSPSHTKSLASPPPTPLGAVPATPSLIKALDRIAVAQKDAFQGDGLPREPASPQDDERGARWADFWREVRDKAR